MTRLLFTLLALGSSLHAAQPNVLFIIVDDLTTTLGLYGNSHVCTRCSFVSASLHPPGSLRLDISCVRFDETK